MSKNKENKEDITLEQNSYVVFGEKKLSSHPVSIIFTIILFVFLIGVISSDLIFLNTIRGAFTIQQASNNVYYQEYINLYPILILNIAFVSAIISNISKRLTSIAKVGYLSNIIISILLFFNLYSNNLRVGISFYLIVLINTLLYLIPINYRIVDEEVEIDKRKENYYEKKNKEIEKLADKKSLTKGKLIFTVCVLVIELISLVIIFNKNNNDIYIETIIQANSDFQIKVINDYINIRESSNIEGEVLGTVNKGDIYNVLDISSTDNHIWYKINYKGKKGYIASPKNNPYIKELFTDKLVVNIFCTKDNQDCGYLMEFLLKYQKSTAKAFLIKYHDLEEVGVLPVYDEVLKHFNIEDTIPLIVIGDNKIINYSKKTDRIIIEVIEEQIDSKVNIVTDIKKGKIKKDS
mgnify:CR=1 FL=1